jgi:glycosyltransferase involved in cell wall biosynthesis
VNPCSISNENMHIQTPIISVIIPIYNDAIYIQEAIKSVLLQKIEEIEIIVVNDGSTDNFEEKIQVFDDPRIRIIKQLNSGAAAARNNGIKNAKGAFLAFLDADDIWSPYKLKLQLEVLINREDINMVYGQVKEFYDSSIQQYDDLQKNVRTFVGYSPITLLISKKDFLSVGDFQSKWKVAEFIDWYDRAKHVGLTEIILPDLLAFRRIHSGNINRLERPNTKQYVAVLKEALDRKRSQK